MDLFQRIKSMHHTFKILYLMTQDSEVTRLHHTTLPLKDLLFILLGIAQCGYLESRNVSARDSFCVVLIPRLELYLTIKQDKHANFWLTSRTSIAKIDVFSMSVWAPLIRSSYLSKAYSDSPRKEVFPPTTRTGRL